MDSTRDKRSELIKEIEQTTKSKLIVLITGDRNRLETQIGQDLIPIIQDALINSNVNNGTISLMIYSLGGDGVAALSLVSLLREYCSTFQVIIPHKAFSAATLIALGANSIIMLKSGQMGPVDVNITTPFNPYLGLPERPQFLPINVEDLYGFVNFAKTQIGLSQETHLVNGLKYLTETVNPLAIGAVHRAREKNKKIASTLLEYHMNNPDIIDSISETITTGLFEHSFIISRKDAKNLKLPVKNVDENMEKSIWNLFKTYSDIIGLNALYNPELLIENADEKEILFCRAIIEHYDRDKLKTNAFITKKKFFKKEIEDPKLKIKLPQIIEKDLDQGWYEDNTI